MINPPELPVNDETQNDAHVASTGVQLYQRTSRVATSQNGKLNMHQKVS